MNLAKYSKWGIFDWHYWGFLHWQWQFAAHDCVRRNQKLETLYFLGMRLYCSSTQSGRFKVGFLTERTWPNRFLNTMKFNMRMWRHLPLCQKVKLINRRLSGHINYYAIISSYPALKRVYYQTLKYWRTVLSSRSQRGRMNWETYRKVLFSCSGATAWRIHDAPWTYVVRPTLSDLNSETWID